MVNESEIVVEDLDPETDGVPSVDGGLFAADTAKDSPKNTPENEPLRSDRNLETDSPAETQTDEVAGPPIMFDQAVIDEAHTDFTQTMAAHQQEMQQLLEQFDAYAVQMDQATSDGEFSQDEQHSHQAEVNAMLAELDSEIAALQSKMALSDISPAIADQIANLQSIKSQLQLALASPTEVAAMVESIRSSIESAISSAKSDANINISEFKSEYYDAQMDVYFDAYIKKNRDLMVKAQVSWEDGYDAYKQAMAAQAEIIADFREHNPEIYQHIYTQQHGIAQQKVDEMSPEEKANASQAVTGSVIDEMLPRLNAIQRTRITNSIFSNPELEPFQEMMLTKILTEVGTNQAILESLNKRLEAQGLEPIETVNQEKVIALIKEGDFSVRVGQAFRKLREDPESLTDEDREYLVVGSAINQSIETFMQKNQDKTLTEMFNEMVADGKMSQDQADQMLEALKEAMPIDVKLGELQNMQNKEFEKRIRQQQEEHGWSDEDFVKKLKEDRSFFNSLFEDLNPFKNFSLGGEITYNPETGNYEDKEKQMSVAPETVEAQGVSVEPAFNPETENFETGTQSVPPPQGGMSTPAIVTVEGNLISTSSQQNTPGGMSMPANQNFSTLKGVEEIAGSNRSVTGGEDIDNPYDRPANSTPAAEEPERRTPIAPGV